MVACLAVESAGPGASIQDGGRFGLMRFGVTAAGPMDWTAFETANLAAENSADAAAIEIGTGGLALTTDAPILLAFAGGAFVWKCDDRELPYAARFLLRPGETLNVRSGRRGAFAYCAIQGGIDVPVVMHSRSTHLRSGLGGLHGRMLRGGDRLMPQSVGPDLDDVEILAPWLAHSDAPIRVVLGPQHDHFTDEAVATFLGEEFKLTASADRMAFKFEGPKLAHSKDFNIVSDGIALGAVQVAGDGQPMVLMADRQPTGGYAKIAHVCRADIGRLAQMRPGQTCRFEAVEVAEAAAALRNLEDRIVLSPDCLRPLRLLPTPARLQNANLVSGVACG